MRRKASLAREPVVLETQFVMHADYARVGVLAEGAAHVDVVQARGERIAIAVGIFLEGVDIGPRPI